MELTKKQLEEMIGGVVELAMEKHREALRAEFGSRTESIPQRVINVDEVKEAKRMLGMIALSVANAGKGRDPEKSRKYAEEKLRAPETVMKALVGGTGPEGGFLVSGDEIPGVIELLRAASVFMSMGPTTIPLVNGTAKMTKMTAGATAYYVGESQNITPSQQTFGQVALSEKKLAAITPVSNDLIKYPSADAINVVQGDIVSAVGTKTDWACIRGSGTSYTPKGIENWTTQYTDVTASFDLAKVTSDLGTLILYLLNSDCRMLNPGFLMAPRTWMYLATVRDGNGNFAFREEILQNRLWGWPVGVTTQIPINLGAGTDESKIYLADFADVVFGDAGTLEIMVSDEAAYWDGANTVAAFSRDETVIRAIHKHDLGIRHEESLGMLNAVDWTP